MQIFDKEAALKAFGRESILKASIIVYLEEVPAMQERLQKSLSLPLSELRETAHWVKGAVSYMHAPAARATAQRLEELCQGAPQPEELAHVAGQLCHELERLGTELAKA